MWPAEAANVQDLSRLHPPAVGVGQLQLAWWSDPPQGGLRDGVDAWSSQGISEEHVRLRTHRGDGGSARAYLVEGETVHHLNGIKDDNRPANLELWVRPQPTGIRALDAVAWAKVILARYADLELPKTDADLGVMPRPASYVEMAGIEPASE